jgi:hypothetical protein
MSSPKKSTFFYRTKPKLHLLHAVLEASSDFATVHRQVFPTQLYVCMYVCMYILFVICMVCQNSVTMCNVSDVVRALLY